MVAPLFGTVSRRPSKTISLICILVTLLITLFHINSNLPNPTTFNPFAPRLLNAESLYYSKDSSSFYTWRTRPFFPPHPDASSLDIKKSATNRRPNSFEPSNVESLDLCANFPTDLLSKVQIVLKTGATESVRYKAHLSTLTSCITNLLVFSDLSEQVSGHEFIDVLADLPPSYYANKTEFETYTAQKAAQVAGEDVGFSKDAWRLDRFKILPMVEQTYAMRPNASWYVFIDTDVYYFWDTLFRLLDQLDPATPHYIGSPAPGSYGRWFAYGGAGTVLSQGLMSKLVGGSNGTSLTAEYEDWVKSDCCGDAVLGYTILNKTGVRLEGLYPMFSGDDLKALKVDKESWCVPLIALHHLSPEQMTELWRWERTRKYNDKPIVHSTLLAHTHTHLSEDPTLDFWDNYSDTTVKPDDSPAHASASACGKACNRKSDCLQYSYFKETCRFANYVRYGRPLNEEVLSGWNTKRMKKMGFKTSGDTRSLCGEAHWLKPIIR